MEIVEHYDVNGKETKITWCSDIFFTSLKQSSDITDYIVFELVSFTNIDISFVTFLSFLVRLTFPLNQEKLN